jgi:ribosomal protein L44E
MSKPTKQLTLREHCQACAELVAKWPKWKRDCMAKDLQGLATTVRAKP